MNSTASLIWGVIFGSIGLGYFVSGIVLIVLPFIIKNLIYVCVVSLIREDING